MDEITEEVVRVFLGALKAHIAETMSTGEVAEVAGARRNHVLYHIKAGNLRAKLIGGGYRVFPEEAKRWADAWRRGGYRPGRARKADSSAG